MLLNQRVHVVRSSGCEQLQYSRQGSCAAFPAMALSTATIIPSKTQSGFALRAFRGPRLSSAHRSVGSSAPTWLLAAGGSVACTARRAFGRRELVNSAGAPLCFALPAAGAISKYQWPLKCPGLFGTFDARKLLSDPIQ